MSGIDGGAAWRWCGSSRRLEDFVGLNIGMWENSCIERREKERKGMERNAFRYSLAIVVS